MALKIKINTKPTNINTSNKVESSTKVDDDNIELIYKKRKLRESILLYPNAYTGPIEHDEKEMFILD